MKNYLIDQLNCADPIAASSLAFQIISTIQDKPPRDQVVATALLFLMVGNHYQVCLREELERADRLIRDLELMPEAINFHALKAYLNGELK